MTGYRICGIVYIEMANLTVLVNKMPHKGKKPAVWKTLMTIFTKKDSFIKRHIREHKKDFSPKGEFLRFTQLYNQFSKYRDKVKIITNKL